VQFPVHRAEPSDVQRAVAALLKLGRVFFLAVALHLAAPGFVDSAQCMASELDMVQVVVVAALA